MAIDKRGRRGKRGSILLLSIFFLIVLLSLSVVFFKIIPAEYHSANHSRRSIQATYAADSGGRHAVSWLKYRWAKNRPSFIISQEEAEQYNVDNFGSHEDDFTNEWPAGSDVDQSILDAHKVDEAWSFLSRIRIDDTDFFDRIYTIETCAYHYKKPVKVAKLVVQNKSFADYALYISDWKNDFVFTMAPNAITGPLHTNGYLRVSVPDSSFWTGTEGPWVSGPLARITQSSAFAGSSTSPDNTLDLDGDGVLYANGNAYAANLGLVPYDSAGTPIADRYDKIVADGRENIRAIQEVPMPEENSYLRTEAWGQDASGTDIPIPTTNAEWKAAAYGDIDSVLVNTESGVANVPDGKVAGGIFVRAKNADDVLLDITPEGHQAIRVRQGKTTVEDPSKVSYFADVPQYKKSNIIPAWEEKTTVCVKTSTKTVQDYKWVKEVVEVTQQNASKCGTHQEFIPGEGGISQPITVANTCTYNVNKWKKVENGTHEENYCSKWGDGDPILHPEKTVWVSADASDPDAVPNGTKYMSVDEDYPGAEPKYGTKSVNNWNSVVEVNDTDYNIPFKSGMKINGEVITDPADPRLTVGDGSTVVINKDYTDDAEYTVMEGRTNGVVFSDVDLKGVRGTNKGAKYEDESGNLDYQGRVLATNVGAGKKIEIRDSILQYYDGSDTDGEGNPLNDGKNRLVPGNKSPGPEHILGLLSAETNLKPSSSSHKYENSDGGNRDSWFSGGGFSGGINVYAVLMAGRNVTDVHGNVVVQGGFGSDKTAMYSNDRLGDFNLYGGVISGVSRQTQKNSGGHNNGFRLNLNYDEIAATFLRYFPQTNQYKALRYVTYQPEIK